MRDRDFEWDDSKAASNLADHGVSFDVTRSAFDDPHAIDVADDRFDYDEDRYVITAMVNTEIVVVAYTIRGGRYRLISARYAEPFEKRHYHEQRRR
jgi:uncharacterized protein